MSDMSTFSRFIQHCFDVWNTSDVALFVSFMVAVALSALVIIAFDLWQSRREERAFNKLHGQFCSTTYCTHRYMQDHKTCVRLDGIDAYLMDRAAARLQQQRDADAEWERIMTATRHL